jgi:hypothetical protein
MNKEEYKLKLHKHRTLKRSILQKDNISLWKKLELYQKEEDKPIYNPEGYPGHGYDRAEKDLEALLNDIDNEIKKGMKN